MITDQSLKEKLILDLHTVNAVKFGEFKLKSGLLSPYYLDLRVLVSYPYLLEQIADIFWEELRLLDYDLIVGVPYTAIPIATAISLKHTQTMVFVRKEAKEHGIKRAIEGVYHKGRKAVVIDDVITNGESKLLTIKPLKEEGLIVEDIVVLLDRGQGGPELLRKNGYNCHAIFTMSEVLDTLLKYRKVPKELIEKSQKFMKETREQFLKAT